MWIFRTRFVSCGCLRWLADCSALDPSIDFVLFLLTFNYFHHNFIGMGRLYRITPGELLRHGAKDLGFVADFVTRM
jgi:hypothetical protein